MRALFSRYRRTRTSPPPELHTWTLARDDGTVRPVSPRHTHYGGSPRRGHKRTPSFGRLQDTTAWPRFTRSLAPSVCFYARGGVCLPRIDDCRRSQMHRGTEIMVDSDSSECARHIRARAFCCPQEQRGRRYNGSPLIGGVGRGSCVRLGSDPASRLGSRMQYLAAPRRAHMCMPLVQRSIRQRGHGPGAARSLYRRRAGRASWLRSISVSARCVYPERSSCPRTALL
ncbi:hypothetical protein C8Q77DRAFT_496459 [Trametes polyzona]|nr:hypothetical protein C8Q77DRAFT_496459 [Trametes polyzona]